MEELPQKNLELYDLYKETIAREVSKRQTRWRLDAVNYIVWEDIEQQLTVHVIKKIHLWDKDRSPIQHWLNRLISNQIKNLLRNLYGAFQSPCCRCIHNLGGDKCAVFKTQSNPSCSLFLKWYGGKRFKQEIQFAQSQDAEIPGEGNHNLKRELISRECNFLNFDKKIPEFQTLLKSKLRPLEWRAYTYLFIDYLSDIQTAKNLGYDTSGNKNSTGYKTVLKIKTKIYKIAREVVANMEF